MSDKAYKKIYVNGDCVVDFTKQTIKTTDITSGNTFFDKSGKLKNGINTDLTWLFENGDYTGELPRVTIIHPTESFDFWGVYAMSTLYHKKLGELKIDCSSLYQIDPYCICTSSVAYHGARFNISLSGNISQNIFNTIIHCSDNTDCFDNYYTPDVAQLKHAIYTDSTNVQIPNGTVLTRNRIATDVSFGTTEDEIFNYVKTKDNKIFITSINEHAISGIQHLNIPDRIEDCPVVHLCDNLCVGLGYDMFDISHLPCELETMSISAFPDISLAPTVTLPDTLKEIQGAPHTELSREFDIDSSTRLDGLILPDSFEGFTTLVESSCWGERTCFSTQQHHLNLDGSCTDLSSGTVSTNVEFIPTATNPYAILTRICNPIEGDTLTLPANCIQVAGDICELQVNKLILPAKLKCFNMPPKMSYPYNDYIKEIIFDDDCILIDYNPQVFRHFSALEKVNLPTGFDILAYSGFDGCNNLKHVVFPKTFKYLSTDIFSSSVNNLVIELKCEQPPQCYSSSSLPPIAKISKIIVPKGYLDAYQTATTWKNYISKMEEASE